jgi:hypothetical protein
MMHWHDSRRIPMSRAFFSAFVIIISLCFTGGFVITPVSFTGEGRSLVSTGPINHIKHGQRICMSTGPPDQDMQERIVHVC